MGKAFIDTGFYIHKMVVLKNFVLIADIHKSISLVKFQPEYTKLSFIAKVILIEASLTKFPLISN
jgi:cleavage and polyadenylation specificity factor subunit 1